MKENLKLPKTFNKKRLRRYPSGEVRCKNIIWIYFLKGIGSSVTNLMKRGQYCLMHPSPEVLCSREEKA